MTHQETSLRLAVGVALTVTILLGQPAAGQNPPSPRTPTAPLIVDPPGCLDQDQLLGENGKTREPGAPNQTLSEKLERSEGIICPPKYVDPEIAAPPPAGGRTPVIPPPGSPGGDPTVRPK